MVKHHLIIALRNLKRQNLYSIINILGLSVGMACCFLILLFVLDEWNYDGFNHNADRIYRVEIEHHKKDRVDNRLTVPFSLAEELTQFFPSIKTTARVFPMRGGRPLVIAGGKAFFDERILFADETLFDMFSFPILQGDVKKALQEPHTIILTESMVQKYFQGADPLNQVIEIDRGKVDVDRFVVKGIVGDVPENSHLKFDFLISTAHLEAEYFFYGSNWMHRSFVYTYVLFDHPESVEQVKQNLPAFWEQNEALKLNRALSGLDHFEAYFRPLRDIHLSHLDGDLEAGRDVTDLYLFTTVGFLILFVACINYINLSTARSERRAKEVGVKKLVGAYQKTLVSQFFIEAFLMVGLALVVALALTELSLPRFSVYTGKPFVLSNSLQSLLGVSFILVALCVGFVSGLYPAYYLSAFQPVDVLKGTHSIRGYAVWVRKGLVVTQFVISTALILVTVVMYAQLDFMKNKRLGFDQDQILIITSLEGLSHERRVNKSANGEAIHLASSSIIDAQLLKQELLRNARITSVSGASQVPGRGIGEWREFFIPEQQNETSLNGFNVYVDSDFIHTLGVELLEGRSFNTVQDGGKDVVIVNESFVKQAGWLSGNNRRIEQRSKYYTMNASTGKFEEKVSIENKHIVGVVADFHLQSLHQKIMPTVLNLPPQKDGVIQYFVLKIHPQEMSETIEFIEQTWRLCVPSLPLEFTFLDDQFDRLYRSETQWMNTYGIFALLAIFIGCLGVFGLAAFSAEQRKKEIGIRKVLGACVSEVVMMLSKDFVKLVLIANIIAWPVTYWVMRRWLDGFAYRVELNWEMFLFSGGLGLVVALLTVSYQAWKAARANPIEALRDE